MKELNCVSGFCFSFFLSLVKRNFNHIKTDVIKISVSYKHLKLTEKNRYLHGYSDSKTPPFRKI